MRGYDKLPITLARGEKSTVVDFLISTDGKTLARLDTFDLAKDPVFSINVSRTADPRQPCGQGDGDQLRRPGVPVLRAACTSHCFRIRMARYKDRVRFIYKDNPLPAEMHPWAMHAAVDANCLAAQNGDVYWSTWITCTRHAQEVTGPDRNLPKSFEALDRIARQEATVGRLDTSQAGRLHCQTGRERGARLAEGGRGAEGGVGAGAVHRRRARGWRLPEEQLWLVIDRALRAAGVSSRRRLPLRLPAPPPVARGPGSGK